MRPLVTGATGFVGQRLLARLERPVVLSRNAAGARKKLSERLFDAYDWDPEHHEPPLAAFQQVDTIFHLAGDPVADKRWTPEKKIRLRESRVAGTEHLVDALARLPPQARPKTLISASAIGYYGSRGDEILDEQSAAASTDDFLGEICIAWEREAAKAADLGVRVVMVRIGLVLGPAGGPLEKIVPPFKFWAGSCLGDGRQWMSWIHLDDLVDLLLFAAETPTLRGPVNGVAPNPVTNREFTRVLAEALGVPTLLPGVPAFALDVLVGEFGKVLLASQRIVPKAAEHAGFHFRFPHLSGALRDILAR